MCVLLSSEFLTKLMCVAFRDYDDDEKLATTLLAVRQRVHAFLAKLAAAAISQ